MVEVKELRMKKNGRSGIENRGWKGGRDPETDAMTLRNLFDASNLLPSDHEVFEQLAAGDEVQVERIVSTGQKSPEGAWFDQELDEWVVLIQGEATLTCSDGSKQNLQRGDSVFLRAHLKHRVEFTSANPPCIWIAVHAHMHAC